MSARSTRLEPTPPDLRPTACSRSEAPLIAGAGVLTHDLALTGAIARGLARQLGHGVDVTSHIDGRGVEAAVRSVRHQDLSRVDAVVLVLDCRQHLDDADGSGRRAGRLATVLRSRLTPAASITIVVPPASGNSTAEQVRAFLEAVADEHGALTRVVRLADRVLVASAAERYGIWGDRSLRLSPRISSIRSC